MNDSMAIRSVGMVVESKYPLPDEWKMMSEVAATLVESGIFKVRSKPEAIAKMLAGREAGLPPVFSMQHIHVINGTPGLDGQAMAALLLGSGDVEYSVTYGGENRETASATCEMKRLSKNISVKRTFTWADAVNASLVRKDNWTGYPKDMCGWRALSACARIVAADIIAGMYLIEELGAVTDQQGNIQQADYEVLVDEPRKNPPAPPPKMIDVQPVNKPEQNVKPEPQESMDEPPPVGDEDNQEPLENVQPERRMSGREVADLQKKKMSQHFRIAYGERIKSVNTSLGCKLTSDQLEVLLMAWCKKQGIVMGTVIAPDGKVHMSNLDPKRLKDCLSSMKDPEAFKELRIIAIGLGYGPVEEEEEKEEKEEKPTKDGELNLAPPIKNLESGELTIDQLKEFVKKKNKIFDDELSFAGTKLKVKILRKHNLVMNSAATAEMYKACLDEMTETLDQLASGDVDINDLLK